MPWFVVASPLMRRTWPLINQDISRPLYLRLSSSVLYACLLNPRRLWEFLIRINSCFLPLRGWKPLSRASITRESSLAAIFFNYRSFHNTRALHQSSNKYDHPFSAFIVPRAKVKDFCRFLLDRSNATLRIAPHGRFPVRVKKDWRSAKTKENRVRPFIRNAWMRSGWGSRIAHSAKLIKKYTRWPTLAFNINLLDAARFVLRCPLRRGWECRVNEGWSAGNSYGRRQRGNKNGEDDRKIREGEPCDGGRVTMKKGG